MLSVGAAASLVEGASYTGEEQPTSSDSSSPCQARLVTTSLCATGSFSWVIEDSI
jgi:hypothetical protein